VYKIYDYQYQTGIFHQLIFLLNNSFPWLLGYLIFEYKDKIHTRLPVVVCGLMMIPLVTRLHDLPHNMIELTYIPEAIFLMPLFVYLFRDLNTTAPSGKRYAINHLFFLIIYFLNVILLWMFSSSLAINKLLYSFVPAISFLIYYRPFVKLLSWLYLHVTGFATKLARISYPLYLIHMPAMYICFHYFPEQKFIGMSLAIIATVGLSYLFELFLFEKLNRLINKGH